MALSLIDGSLIKNASVAIAKVIGLQTALDGKAAVSHNHAISDVTNLQTALDAKASSTHGHVIGDVLNLQTNLDAKAPATRSIGVAGLATGGGTLEADRTITVPAASQAEAQAGTDNSKAMTPLRTAQAIAALSGLPAGSVIPYAGSSAPTGYLFCYGQAISRTTYAALFTAIGTAFGTGDGSTTFNLPDLRGRVVAGKDNMGGTSADRLTSALNGDTLGATGGSEQVTLGTTEMPSHAHRARQGNGTSNSQTVVPSGHAYQNTNTWSTYTIEATGGGGAHNNVQPTFILNYIIKT